MVAERKLVGATAAIVLDGRLAAAVASGVRKAGDPTPLAPLDPMHSGSITKGMTALLLARLVEQRRLSFSDTLEAALGEGYQVHEALRQVSVVELLYQRLPLPNPDYFQEKYTAVPIRDARKQYAKDDLAQTPRSKPGVRYEYRNANYVGLGAILERAGGGLYEDLMRREVFGPLNMSTASFGPMGSGKDVSVPWQHYKEDEKWQPVHHDNPPFSYPAGGVHCSVIDLANYAYARVDGSHGNRWYLCTETWRVINVAPPGSSYAGGVLSAAGRGSVPNMSHAGSNNLSCSEWQALDGGRIVVAVMLNTPSDQALKELLDTVVEAARKRLRG